MADFRVPPECGKEVSFGLRIREPSVRLTEETCCVNWGGTPEEQVLWVGMTDYNELIDAETWDFIRETATWYPDDAVTRSIDEQRAIYDAMCRAFHAGYPPRLHVETTEMAGVPVRFYSPGSGDDTAARPSVVYFHGGGFVVGGLESHDDVCAELAHRTGLRLISVDYRLAPEHKHPAAFEDCLAVAHAVAKQNGAPVLVCGDSAGGNLAAAVAHACRDTETVICGQVLVYPGLGGDTEAGSYIRHAHAPMLTREEILFYRDVRIDGSAPDDDPTFEPLSDRSFKGLPPTRIFTAQCDPLASDGPAYASAINAAGGKAICIEEKGLVHGYLRARHRGSRARESFARIVEAVAELARPTA